MRIEILTRADRDEVQKFVDWINSGVERVYIGFSGRIEIDSADIIDDDEDDD